MCLTFFWEVRTPTCLVVAEKHVVMRLQTSVARPAAVAHAQTIRIFVELVPLGTFRLYYVLECHCLIPVQWVDLSLVHFLQAGAHQLLRTFRAAFDPHFNVSGELLCLILLY